MASEEYYIEPRLINAYDLEEKTRQSMDHNPHEDPKIARNHNNEHWHFLKMIVETPTIDAVEVVHAHWEDMWGGKYANPRYQCSACKEKALWKNEQDELLSWHEVQALTDYCPHCGAIMDEKEK